MNSRGRGLPGCSGEIAPDNERLGNEGVPDCFGGSGRCGNADQGRHQVRKSDRANRIAAEALVTPLTAQTVVDITFSEIGEVLARGEKITIRGFGTFATTRRTERVGRNPRTGEPAAIPASTSRSFRASTSLSDAAY